MRRRMVLLWDEVQAPLLPSRSSIEGRNHLVGKRCWTGSEGCWLVVTVLQGACCVTRVLLSPHMEVLLQLLYAGVSGDRRMEVVGRRWMLLVGGPAGLWSDVVWHWVVGVLLHYVGGMRQHYGVLLMKGGRIMVCRGNDPGMRVGGVKLKIDVVLVVIMIHNMLML